jgi:ribonuclease HII
MAKYIIGIDEAGRGPLAGPVTVAAVATTVNPKSVFAKQIPGGSIRNPKFKLKRQGVYLSKHPVPLRDSKKLSPKQREAWFQWIKKHSNILLNVGMFYAVASVSPRIIDKINISNAANLAASRALQKLLNTLTIVKVLSKNTVEIFLDGGLFINSKFKNQNAKLQSKIKKLQNIKTITKGDEKIPAIMLASIVAKVSRDRQMFRLHKKYPKYGFDKHKGYATKKHIKAIKKHGRSPMHRKSFKVSFK